ncbi:MAG: TonB-dependent receptor domain-containing protein, partial [Balneolaceae bacterium]
TFTHDNIGFLESGAFGINGFWRELNVSGQEALTPDAENFFLAGFLFEEIGITESVSLLAGTRLEFRRLVPLTNEQFQDVTDFDKRNDLIFSGSVGLNIKPVRNVEIGTQIARAFRTPTVEELFSNAPHPGNGTFDIGDASLSNETSLGADLFIRYNNRNFALEMAGFVNRIDNFVKFTPTGRIDQPSGLPVFEYNSADAMLFGFEFSSSARLTNRWTTNLVIDFVQGSERDSENTPLPFMPPLRSSLELQYDQSDWWTGTKVRLINTQNRLAPEEERTPGYALVGLQAGYRFQTFGSHSIVLRLDNLLNASYRDHLSRVENRNNPMPGRNANISWKWSF